MKIIVKFPSRSRPDKFFSAIDNLLSMAKNTDFQIHATLDNDDYTMTSDATKKRIAEYSHIIPSYGYSRSKVHAINRDMPEGDWDIVILHSDDMRIIKEGFDLDVISDFNNNLDQVIHYTDGFEHGEILSWPVIGRKYYDRFKYIYSDAYKSLFCDEEVIYVSDKLGKLKRSTQKLIEHHHPAWVPGLSIDPLLKHTQSFYHIDRQVFLRRKQHNFFV